jgi:hypothetical protein
LRTTSSTEKNRQNGLFFMTVKKKKLRRVRLFFSFLNGVNIKGSYF